MRRTSAPTRRHLAPTAVSEASSTGSPVFSTEGWKIEPEDLAEISPYLTAHIMRCGEYSTHEPGTPPEAYEVHLNVDFTRLDPDAVPEAA